MLSEPKYMPRLVHVFFSEIWVGSELVDFFIAHYKILQTIEFRGYAIVYTEELTWVNVFADVINARPEENTMFNDTTIQDTSKVLRNYLRS